MSQGGHWCRIFFYDVSAFERFLCKIFTGRWFATLADLPLGMNRNSNLGTISEIWKTWWGKFEECFRRFAIFSCRKWQISELSWKSQRKRCDLRFSMGNATRYLTTQLLISAIIIKLLHIGKFQNATSFLNTRLSVSIFL